MEFDMVDACIISTGALKLIYKIFQHRIPSNYVYV